MDQPSPPTAAELGVSDAEYARILRDLRARRGEVEQPPPPAVPSHRAGWLLFAAIAGGLAVLTLLLATAGSDGDGEPAYAFLQTNGDQPVTYTSCRPIQVAVYPAGGPPDAEALVREAVAQVRAATGLDIVVTGAFGGHAPNWNFEAGPTHPEDPVSVSWQDGEAIAQLTDHVAGVGGSRTVTNPDGSRRWVAGTIALSSDYYAFLTEEGDHDQALAVLLHEFGHVLGLDHVDSPAELMYEDNIGLASFGAGDLAGLRLLGQGPCV